jgi:hypothetical protein
MHADAHPPIINPKSVWYSSIVHPQIGTSYKMLQVLSIHNRLIKYTIMGFLFHLQIQKPGLLSTPRAPHSTFHLSHGSLKFLTGHWICCASYKKTWLLRNSFHGFPVDSPKQTNTQIYPENSNSCKWQWWSTWRFWDCTMDSDIISDQSIDYAGQNTPCWESPKKEWLVFGFLRCMSLPANPQRSLGVGFWSVETPEGPVANYDPEEASDPRLLRSHDWV